MSLSGQERPAHGIAGERASHNSTNKQKAARRNKLSPQELARRHAQRQESERRRHEEFGDRDDCVLSFDQWCRVNGFSKSTGRRIKQSGNGPNFTQLSPNRVGVTVGENRRWLASRKIG